MARKYTQTTRILKSFQAYNQQVEKLSEKYNVQRGLSFQDYKNVYTRMSAQGRKNIARTIAYEYNITTSSQESRYIAKRIKEEFGDDPDFREDFYSAAELRKLSGRELWDYLKDLGLSDREAGAIYDGEQNLRVDDYVLDADGRLSMSFSNGVYKTIYDVESATLSNGVLKVKYKNGSREAFGGANYKSIRAGVL